MQHLLSTHCVPGPMLSPLIIKMPLWTGSTVSPTYIWGEILRHSDLAMTDGSGVNPDFKILEQCLARSRHSINIHLVILSPGLLSQHQSYCKKRWGWCQRETAKGQHFGRIQVASPNPQFKPIVQGHRKLSPNHCIARLLHCRAFVKQKERREFLSEIPSATWILTCPFLLSAHFISTVEFNFCSSLMQAEIEPEGTGGLLSKGLPVWWFSSEAFTLAFWPVVDETDWG